MDDLKGGQQVAYNDIISLLKAGEKRIRLIGSAGTGKTYLTGKLVEYLRYDSSYNQERHNGIVYVTAPTNKALSVLQKKITASVEFMTIHKAIKLTRYIDKLTGICTFVKQKSNYSKFEDFDRAKVAIIDESSMLNTDFVGGEKDYGKYKRMVKGYLEDYPFPIIFVGDDKQLAPIGELESPVFTKDYPTVKLTEIIRQGIGNPIIDLSNDLDRIYFKVPRLTSGKGYVYSDDKRQIIEDLAEVNGTDELKYLAFTNNSVDEMNSLVRQRRYSNPKKIEKLETIVFDKPHGKYYTNEEAKVEDVVLITDYINVPRYNTKFDRLNQPVNEVDKVKVKYYRINDSFNVIHEHSEKIFEILSLSLTANCRKNGWDWRGFYYFTEQFADIKYNHALTIHKSQGSTYKDTIINIADIELNRVESQKRRMLYTAVTRASNSIILNNVK